MCLFYRQFGNFALANDGQVERLSLQGGAGQQRDREKQARYPTPGLEEKAHHCVPTSVHVLQASVICWRARRHS